MKRSALAACCVLALSAAGCGTPSAGWQRTTDHSPPNVGDTSQCRGEAHQQAMSRYPDRIQSAGGSEIRVADPDRSSAEQTFFAQCMQRLGYQRAN